VASSNSFVTVDFNSFVRILNRSMFMSCCFSSWSTLCMLLLLLLISLPFPQWLDLFRSDCAPAWHTPSPSLPRWIYINIYKLQYMWQDKPFNYTRLVFVIQLVVLVMMNIMYVSDIYIRFRTR
jgi:hypothetical protein